VACKYTSMIYKYIYMMYLFQRGFNNANDHDEKIYYAIKIWKDQKEKKILTKTPLHILTIKMGRYYPA